MSKLLASVAVCLSLTLAACSGTSYNSDEVPDVSAENLYSVAKASLSTGDYYVARHYLEAIDSRYPFGELTEQVQLDLILVYYKTRETELAQAQINRFLRLYPTHPNVDYVYYMKGLVELQFRSDPLQDFFGLDRSEKDITMYRQAFNTFRDLIKSFPDSIYVADARQRMIYIKNEMGKRELAIANYYFERQSYLSAIRHCQNILYTYRSTDSFKPAMELMIKAYEILHLTDPAENTRKVLDATFNGKDPVVLNTYLPSGKKVNNEELPIEQQDDSSWWESFKDFIGMSEEKARKFEEDNFDDTMRWYD